MAGSRTREPHQEICDWRQAMSATLAFRQQGLGQRRKVVASLDMFGSCGRVVEVPHPQMGWAGGYVAMLQNFASEICVGLDNIFR